MSQRTTTITLVLWLLGISSAYAQQWFTAAVAKEVGYAPCDGCAFGREKVKPVNVGNGRISAVTMFVFDTTATYAQGRIVDLATGKPINAATIQAQYTCWQDCEQKTAVANEAGFFRLGWVGCHGPKSGLSNRPLLVQAPGYQTIRTESVDFGGGAYLHIELAAVRE